MQISRMPIPADDCANSEMSVDANPADTKSELETTKVNGDSHKKLNGSAVVDNTKEAGEVLIAEKEEEEKGGEVREIETEGGEKEVECEEGETEEKEEEDKESTKETESLPECTEKPEENGAPTEVKETIEKVKLTDEEETSTAIVEIPKDIAIKREDVKPMEVDSIENQLVNHDVIIKKEPDELDNLKVETGSEIQIKVLPEKGNAIHIDELVKNEDKETNPINGDIKLSDEEKIIKSEKTSPKATEEEDVCSEISTDTPSPKQVPIIIFI